MQKCGWGWSVFAFMDGIGAFVLQDQFSDVDVQSMSQNFKNAQHSIIVKRIILRFRWWNRHQSHRCKEIYGNRCPKLASNLAGRLALVSPLGQTVFR